MKTEENKESDYIGNMWGWKFSAASGVLLIVVLLLTLPQQKQYLKDGTQSIPSAPPIDTTKTK